MDEVVDALREVVSELQDLNRSLEQVSDGLFYLSLHVGADVSSWTGSDSSNASSPSLGVTGSAHSQGVVKWYNTEKGFGFISQTGGGPDVFVHYSIVPAPGYLHEGQRVTFEVGAGEHGPVALNLQLG